MKKQIESLLLIILLFGARSILFAGDSILIESHLFKGLRGTGISKQGAQVIITTFSAPFLVPSQQPSSAVEAEFEFVSSMKDELANIYQLKNVDHLTSSSLIWDGKKESVNETIFVDENIYPITLYPKVLSDQKINLKIIIYKLEGKVHSVISPEGENIERPRTGLLTSPLEIRFSNAEAERLLDTEIVIKLNDPVVLGFPVKEESYFLSVLFKKKVEYEVLGGVVSGPIYVSIQSIDPVCGKKVGRGSGFEKEDRAAVVYNYKGETYLFCTQECSEKFKKNPEKYIKKEASKDINRIVRAETEVIIPPKPVLQTIPVYPEKVKAEKIEGTVVLEVSTDKNGNVDKVRVLKSLHPELDKAAQDALMKWKYEKVLKDGKPVPTLFAVSVEFKLREEINNDDGVL